MRRVRGWIEAVDGVDLGIARGRTLALVGESGCGKTTAGKALLRLVDASGGELRLDGVDLRSRGRAALRPVR
ncbi:MAG: ATP-binding cassette domain-containing protein, partial [bacterium]